MLYIVLATGLTLCVINLLYVYSQYNFAVKQLLAYGFLTGLVLLGCVPVGVGLVAGGVPIGCVDDGVPGVVVEPGGVVDGIGVTDEGLGVTPGVDVGVVLPGVVLYCCDGTPGVPGTAGGVPYCVDGAGDAGFVDDGFVGNVDGCVDGVTGRVGCEFDGELGVGCV